MKRRDVALLVVVIVVALLHFGFFLVIWFMGGVAP